MQESKDAQPPTGPEQLERRITLASFLTGGSLALWLVPVAFLFLPVPHSVLNLVVGLAGACAVGTFLLGVLSRAQLRCAVWRNAAVADAVSRHHELTEQIQADHDALIRLMIHNNSMLQQSVGDVRRRVDAVAGKVGRDYFGVYSEVLTDLQGGPEQVNNEVTKPIGYTGNQAKPCGNVVPMPGSRTANGRH